MRSPGQPPRSKATAGFTLLELLVATAIVGVLISAIVVLTGGFLRYSGRVSTINDRLAELSDASGYIATNVRGAMQVIGGGASSVDITADGNTFTCSTTSVDGPCIALVVPVVDRTTTASDIVGFNLLAYRVIPLSAWDADPGLRPGWNGVDTPLMLEYRVSLCTGCSTPPVVPAAVSAGSSSLIIPDLFLEDNAGVAVQPFQVFLGTARMSVTLRSRGVGREQDVTVPADGPLVLTVVRRP